MRTCTDVIRVVCLLGALGCGSSSSGHPRVDGSQTTSASPAPGVTTASASPSASGNAVPPPVAANTAGMAGTTPNAEPTRAGSAAAGMAMPAGGGGSGGASTPEPGGGAKGCAPRMVSGGPELHFHHVHFNTADVAADIEFFMKFFNGVPADFCQNEASGMPTRAIRAERGYFLFNLVAKAPDPMLDSHLEHIGYLSADPGMELHRLMGLGVKLWAPGDNLQCAEVANGTACFNNGYFYAQAPNGARIEVAGGPGPAKSGFGHVHLRGEFPDFYGKVLGPALMAAMEGGGTTQHVDQVNITNLYLERVVPANPVDSKDKPISHVAYSTTDLMGNLERIKGEGIELAEEPSFKPEYGFNSFFVKSPQGVWVEIVEDSPFQP